MSQSLKKVRCNSTVDLFADDPPCIIFVNLFFSDWWMDEGSGPLPGISTATVGMRGLYLTAKHQDGDQAGATSAPGNAPGPPDIL